MRIGQGYDIHRLVPGKKGLVIGGIHVPAEQSAEAHSDGDVLIHALIDALLGAASMGDIGFHYPPSDMQYKNIESRELLRRTAALLKDKGIGIRNVDTTVVIEKPKLQPYIPHMKRSISTDLGIKEKDISIKAKTKEGMDATGKGNAIEAQAVVLIEAPLAHYV